MIAALIFGLIFGLIMGLFLGWKAKEAVIKNKEGIIKFINQ